MIDEKVRHSISKYANLHFPASKQAEDILTWMGEDPNTIFNYGSITLDACRDIKDVGFSQKQLIVLYNPYNEVETEEFKKYLFYIIAKKTELFNNLPKIRYIYLQTFFGKGACTGGRRF
jgi:UDP-N-acetylglucosamine 2-epimerase